MGEEVFQLHVATPTYGYMSYVFKRPDKDFFPCWYVTGSSLPAGARCCLKIFL